MKEVYRALKLNDISFITTNLETAEMIKYASNAFLAMKITYVNEIAILCEKIGADIQVVGSAMGRERRISSKFLYCGPGYGGELFSKRHQGFGKDRERMQSSYNFNRSYHKGYPKSKT